VPRLGSDLVAALIRRDGSGSVAVLGAALGGALFCLGYVGFGWWPLALAAWAVLWTALDAVPRRSIRGTALVGFAFGWVAHAGGYAWLWRLVDVFLAGRVAIGAALWLLHSLWFATGYAIYAVVVRSARLRGWPIALAGGAPLVALEWLYPQLFPVHVGDSFVDQTRLVQIADLGGPLLVTALAALANAAVYEMVCWIRDRRRRPRATIAAAVAAIGASAAYGALRVGAVERDSAAAPALRVGVVQGNADVLEKRRDPEGLHDLYLAQTHELIAPGEPLDLVVWPETVYTRGIRGPLPVAGRPVAPELVVPLVFGASSHRVVDGRLLRFNSAFLIGADGAIRDGYDKNLLVPFAENLPFRTELERFFPQAQDFGAAADTPPLALGPWRLSTPICYEAAVPSFVRRMVERAQPHLLVMLSNDAWFGDSQEPWIHLAVARMRAIEHHRWAVRATNGGVSALIDPAGRVVARTGLLTRENLRGTVRLLDGETVYGRYGDWVGWLAATATAGMALLRAPRSASRSLAMPINVRS
jgi:apolipoprotein N-acyltransferase